MSEDQENKKNGDSISPSPDEDSSGEMDVIKGIFGKEEPLISTSDSVFSEDLFGGPEKKDEAATQADAASTTPPEEPSASPQEEPAPETDEEASKEPDTPFAPEPAQAKAGDSIKVVTDDDLRQLFDASIPGFKPGEAKPDEAPAGDSEPAKEEKEEAPEPEPPREEAAAEPESAAPVHEEVEEIGLETTEPDAAPPEPEPEPEEKADEPVSEETPSDTEEKTDTQVDISAEDIVDQIETKAEVGDMTAVAAAKKGDPLKKTEELIQDLEPAEGDFMSVDELKKLVNNVQILIEWTKGAADRLDRIEQSLEKLIEDKDK